MMDHEPARNNASAPPSGAATSPPDGKPPGAANGEVGPSRPIRKRRIRWTLALALLTAIGIGASYRWRNRTWSESDIKRLGGEVGTVSDMGGNSAWSDWARPMAKFLHIDRHFEPIAAVRIKNDSITDDDLRHITGMPELEILDLSSAKVTDAGLVHLKGLDKLIELKLSGTSVTGTGIGHLRQLKMLQWIELNDCPVTGEGLAQITRIPGLNYLMLNGTPLADIDFERIADRDKPFHLGLSGCSISDDGLRILSRKAISGLNLGNTAVTDAGIDYLTKLSKLSMMELPNTKVTDAGIAKLVGCSSLKYLRIRWAPVTAATALELLKRLNLEEFDLRDTGVSDDDLQRLKSAYPKCRFSQ